MKTIRDAVHANIDLSGAEVAVLDTPPMQRLRYVKQLALAHLVYPSAVHSRFEHSLGTLHLTGIAASRLFGKDAAALLRLAGLLHDVGHGAFSHLSEPLLVEKTGKNHEQLGRELIAKSEISDALDAGGFSAHALISEMSGPRESLVSSAFGTDRIDYLLRDAHFTGASYSLVDAERLLSSFAFESGALVLQEKGLLAAESLLVSRYLMFRAIYNHHANRIASKMMENALRTALESGKIAIGDIAGGNDYALLFSLKDEPLVARILSRRLFKTAFSAGEGASAQSIEAELLAEYSLEDFVVCGDLGSLASPDVALRRKDGSKSTLLTDSFLSREVDRQMKAQGVLVACGEKDAKKVGAFCARLA
ncbi:MAG: HD domain-containing protein [Candidatus Micrarchaeota archaeon]